MRRREVFVAGVGAVTPLGATWPASLAALADGESAVAPVAHFDVTGFPCTVAAAVRHAPDDDPDRRWALARPAADEAWAQAGVDAVSDKIGVFVGAESGRASLATVVALARAAGGGKSFDHQAFGERGRAFASRIDASVLSPAAVASRLAARFGARGPVETLSLACASGLAAVVEGARAVRLGLVDVALVGGVGADVDPLMLVGFGLLGALSAKGLSRPFDLKRDGFVVGEGAAFAVLAADPQGARARVTGLGRSLDAYHLTAPDPDGAGAERAMRAALEDARSPSVSYVQAHGTSTPLNDAVEAAAIARCVGQDARVSSVKGALGHWIAGAGALGFLCAVEAVASGTLLPTAGLRDPDPACDIRHVVGEAVRQDCRAAIVNAFAFGGANASVVVERA